ncbi:ATP-binding cassette domain-containing protein [Varibaculum vaginae]|uniref:ATP-binding cassette domain-containing protein n=1 Tax=Varibaculum vaginae TaxID=2364797 RepID=UPI000F08B588|nr:ATP-binding cassette domain-containing protein [Varibaculum vaginae]
MVNPADARLKTGLQLPSSVSDPVITVNNLTKDYVSGAGKVRALDHISIGIARRHFTAIMGPSGSGKSTFMHCLAGFESATSGSIKIDGTEIVGMNQRRLTRLRRDHISFIFQAFNLIPTLNAKENILLPFEIARRKVPQERFERVIAALGLKDRLSHRPSELSGGQQQRVACARALMQDAVVLFADEPTGNLDSESSQQVLHYLREAVNDFGQSVVMVTHEASAASYADRVLFLLDGKIVAELDHPERERVLAAQTKLPQFVQSYPLERFKSRFSRPETIAQKGKGFLPAGNKTGAWPDREKMQEKLANLQVARGAKIEVKTSPITSAPVPHPADNPVTGLDTGAINALMGPSKPVVPAELLTKEGARRALAREKFTPKTTKRTVARANTTSTSNLTSPAKPKTAPKKATPQLSGSVWKTHDERGTTWQGWTPKPGQQPTKTSKDEVTTVKPAVSLPSQKEQEVNLKSASSKGDTNVTTKSLPVKKRSVALPLPKQSLKSTPTEPASSAVATNLPLDPPESPLRKDSQRPEDSKRWSDLYSVFSNPVKETSDFWEDMPANKNDIDTTKSQVKSTTKHPENSEKTSKNWSRHIEAATKYEPTSSLTNPSNTRHKTTGDTGNLTVKTNKKDQASDQSRPIPRTPEDTLSQEKQRLLAMIKKAEALLDSSQDAIASFHEPRDKA